MENIAKLSHKLSGDKGSYFAINAYCKSCTYKHFRINSDNTTAISNINNKGGIKSIMCDKLAREIWGFCKSRKLFVSADHILGKENTTADKFSRIFNHQTEWMLNPNIYKQILKKFQFSPNLDLFASRLNHQTDQYVSWMPDPCSVTVDAISMSWASIKFYAYPPFSMVGAVADPDGRSSRSCDGQMLKDQCQTFLLVTVSIRTSRIYCICHS